MKPLFVVEGEADRVLIAAVLDADPAARGRYRIQAAGGKGSAVSLARTYLLTRDELHIVVVLDADSTDAGHVSDEYGLATELLEAAGPRDRFRLLMATPSVESILFADRPLADALFGRALTDAEWVEATLAPRAALGRLVRGGFTPATLSKWLARRDLTLLADVPFVRDLRDAVAVPHAA